MQHLWGWLKQKWASHKRLIYLFILAVAIAFLGEALYRHWQGVSSIQITPAAWSCLVLATGVTLLSHIWTGWVWGWILQELGQPVSNIWSVHVYLTTNVAKYIPSNLVHLYGRTILATEIGVPLGAASLSVVLDTLLMASAGLIVGLLSIPQRGQFFAILGLILVLGIVHPRILQQLVKFVPKSTKAAKTDQATTTIQLERYPLKPLLGEMGFVLGRSLGFVITLSALTSLDLVLIPKYISIYSIGWLLGFIVPVPGGIGVLELTTSTLLSQPGVLTSEQTLSVGLALGAVGLHRLVNTIAEALGAGLATLDMKVPLKLQ